MKVTTRNQPQNASPGFGARRTRGRTGASALRLMCSADRGYTLVEMIIAMVLVSALMSSVWTIMSLYNGLLTAGRDRTTEQQLVRSLFELVNEDIAGVNAVATQSLSTEFGDSFEDSVFDGSAFSDIVLQDQTTRPGVGTLSVTGTSTALRLRIRSFQTPDLSPPSDIDLLNELGGGSAGRQESDATVAEFQTVVYQIVAHGGGGANSAADQIESGLYRIQVDTQSLDYFESSQSSAELQRRTDSTEISRQNLAMLRQLGANSTADAERGLRGKPVPQVRMDAIPEIVSCQFEYFDGSNWLSSWTNDQLQTLPAAVRVSFDVVSQSDLDRLDPTSGKAASGPESETVSARRYSRTILLNSTGGSL